MSLLSTGSFANPSTALFGPPPSYASFSSADTQSIPALLATPATFDTVDITPFGISNPAPSTLRIGVPGVYKVQASAQCDRTALLLGDLEMFIQVNLTPVPNSTTRIQINQNQEVVMTVEWLLDLDAGDDVFIQFYSGTVGQRILAIPAAGGVPAIPSIIVTFIRIA